MDSELQDGVPTVQLGLITVHENERADVDIIAVHGLGAYPPRAWSREVTDPDGTPRFVNWLSDKDMLPAEIPSARVLTFNYESRWLWEAPRQTTVICATQMLNAIDGLRQKEFHTRDRPIVLVGHSFGGVVIEQAIMRSITLNSVDSTCFGLAQVTAGIVFLGALLRGSAASGWGSMIAWSASCLGFSTEQRILDDLAMDSENLKNLLADFGIWLWEHKVAVWCFFEQYETDYGKRFGFSWKQMVVDEYSACIDVAQREALPADHFKITKLADRAPDAAWARANPSAREYKHDSRDISEEDGECIKSLFHDLSQPVDDMTRLRNAKDWLQAEHQASLWVCGPPGIGKTILSIHIVGSLIRHTKVAPLKTLFAFFFCDHSRKYTAADIVRSWIVQLVQQQPRLGSYLHIDFGIHGDSLRPRFEPLCRILLTMMSGELAQQTILLVDALDECDASTQKHVCDFIKHDLATLPSPAAKILVVSRLEKLIEESLVGTVDCIRIYPSTVSNDLGKYIDQEVSSLQQSRRIGEVYCEKLKTALLERNGGTFLWVSLVLQRIRTAKTVTKMMSLATEEEDSGDAIFMFRILVVIDNWLSTDDLAMVYCMKTHTRLPAPSDVAGARGCHEYCGSFITSRVLDPDEWRVYRNGRISCHAEIPGFIHASVKDYFTSSHLENHPKLSRFYCDLISCHLRILEYCLDIRRLAEQGQDVEVGWPGVFDDRQIGLFEPSEPDPDPSLLDLGFSSYTPMREYCSPLLASRNIMDHLMQLSTQEAFTQALPQTFRIIDLFENQSLFVGAVLWRSVFWINHLIKLPWVDVNYLVDKQTALMWAVAKGDSAIPLAELLLSHPRTDINIYCQGHGTALMKAVEEGYEGMVNLLLAHPKIDVNVQAPRVSMQSWDSALFRACRYSRATMVKPLLALGASLHPDMSGASIIQTVGEVDIGISSPEPASSEQIKLTIAHLLDAGLQINGTDEQGRTALHSASAFYWTGGLKASALLSFGANPEIKDNLGETPIVCATKNTNVSVLSVLLSHGISVESEDDQGNTLLILAVGGEERLPTAQTFQTARLLLEAGANVNHRNRQGETAIMMAAKFPVLLLDRCFDSAPCILSEDKAIVNMLLDYGVDFNVIDYQNRSTRARCTKLWLRLRFYHEIALSTTNSDSESLTSSCYVKSEQRPDGDHEHALTTQQQFKQTSEEGFGRLFAEAQQLLMSFYEVMLNFPHDSAVVQVADLQDIILEEIRFVGVDISRGTELVREVAGLKSYCDLLNDRNLRRTTASVGRNFAKKMGWTYEPWGVRNVSDRAMSSHAFGDISMPRFSSKNFYANFERQMESSHMPTVFRETTYESGHPTPVYFREQDEESEGWEDGRDGEGSEGIVTHSSWLSDID